MFSKSGLQLVAWIGMAYLAAIVQIRWTDGLNVVLALAAVWLCRHPGSRGVLGVAITGLLLDAVGNDRLGLHLGLCGLLAALTVTALSGWLTARWWMPPLIAAWLVFGDAAMTAGVLSATSSVPFDLSDTLRTAGRSALATGALVGGVTLLAIAARRCLSLPANVSGVRLNNQWNRLTDA
jgi:cell shape-determining protein MreD